VSVCLSTHNSKTVHLNFAKFFMHVACGCGSVLLRGIAIHFILKFLWMTSCFHTMGPIGGWMGMVSCSLLAPVDVAPGRLWATAAHWLAGLAGRLAGPLTRPGDGCLVA